jgi:hypothetical protein
MYLFNLIGISSNHYYASNNILELPIYKIFRISLFFNVTLVAKPEFNHT